MTRASDLKRLLASQVLAAGLEVDGVVAAPISGIRIVVQVGRKADVNPTERIDHVAERFEVDGDVAVEGQPRDLPHLVLRRVASAIASLVLRGDAADDVRIRNLVCRVDLVVPNAARS